MQRLRERGYGCEMWFQVGEFCGSDALVVIEDGEVERAIWLHDRFGLDTRKLCD